MEEAGTRRPGAMAAVLGLGTEALRGVCEPFGVTLANLNAPGQVVISGERDAVERASSRATELGARRVVPLNVGAAFHSPLMEEAAREMAGELDTMSIRAASVPVIANVSATPVQAPEEIRTALNAQMTSAVRWEESIRRAVAMGVDTLIEVGPGNVLSGLARRIDRSLTVYTVNDPTTAATTLAALKGQ
jgi:[acyl-carrier-protein] S-malonyltransferase